MDGTETVEADLSDANLSDRDLVLQFESLGDNCELGLVQRRVGAEPLGLLRFAGAPLHNLLRAFAGRFGHVGEPAFIRLQPENGEYMVKLTKYDFTYHSDVKIGDMEPARLLRQQSRIIGFLARKLIDDLENPSKIFVFRQNEPVSAGDLIDLRLAIAGFGPGRLLWVQPACPGHPPGTVVLVDERLIVGYVRRLAGRGTVPNLDLQSWLSVLRGAWRIAQPIGPLRSLPGAGRLPMPARTEVTFGADGNAVACQGYGWSGAEAGYTWAIGERSLLTIPSPGSAADYWLEMDVTPYVKPPLLTRQRLDVYVSGTLVQSFDPLPRGSIGCVVPGNLVADRDRVEIVLGHPHAASPMLVAGQGDDRRLGVSFTRLALVCA